MSCRVATLTFLAVVFALCASSRADEDGSFCTSIGYLAYELSNGTTPGVAGHVLKVVRFGPERGMYMAGEVTLQDFQVHRMICSQDRVEISGWGNIYKKYIIDVGGQKLNIVDFTEEPTKRFDPSKDGPEPSSFRFAEPGTLALESADPDRKYTLLLSASDKIVQGGVEHHRKAELIQANSQGTALQNLVLYEGDILETID